MKDLLTADNGSLAAKAGELSEKGMNAVQTLKSQNIWDVLANIIPQDWNDTWDAFKMQMLTGLLIIVVLILLLSVMPSVVRNFLRGLDVAVIGGVMVWLGTRVPEIIFVTEMEVPLIGIGIALIVLGLAIFIIAKIHAGRKNAKQRYKAEAEAKAAKDAELEKRAEKLAEPAEVELKLPENEK